MTNAPAAEHAKPTEPILQWQMRALDYVVFTMLGLGAGVLVVVFLAVTGTLPPALRLLSAAIYLMLVAIALARRVSCRVRAWGLLLVGYALAVVTLATRGLSGHGRIILVIMPIYATILIGPRSGYVAGALSLALFAAFAWLVPTGRLLLRYPTQAGAGGVQLWLLQGVMLVFGLVPIMVLVNQFVVLMRRTLDTERGSNRRLVEAEREQRRLERILLDTGERERRVVGHQLHDGPCQQITAALLRCRVAENSLAAHGSHEEAAHLAAVAELLDASVGEIHDLARGLSPAELSHGALGAAFDDLARTVRASGAVDCEVRCAAPPRLDDPETASQLFRIAQEAVSNAMRHACARRIEIALAEDHGALRLRVRDDGVGLPDDRRPEGMGLRIMRYRAELIRGELSIGPAVGGGTVVECTLPVTARDASGDRDP